MVCLKNDYSVNEPIYNGQLWHVHHVAPGGVVPHVGKWLPRLNIELRNDEGGRTDVSVPSPVSAKAAKMYRADRRRLISATH